MNKLEELKALIEIAAPGPLRLINDNEGTEYKPLWMIENGAASSEDEDRPLQLTLHLGVKEDLELFIVMRNLLPDLIAVTEAANAVYQGHKVETGYVEDGYLGGSLATEKALADALTPLTKDADK